MLALDTNVLLRHLVHDDDEQQSARVAAALSDAIDDGHDLYIPLVVLVESVWVLRQGLKVSRARAAAMIGSLLDVQGVRVADADLVRGALARYKEGKADFSDYLVEADARRAGCGGVLTFDDTFAKSSKLARLVR